MTSNEGANTVINALEQLFSLSSSVIDQISAGELSDARNSLDKLRFRRAILKDQISQEKISQLNIGQQSIVAQKIARSIQENIDLIENWRCSFLEQAKTWLVSSDENQINLALDFLLPTVWNFYSDIFLLDLGEHNVIVKTLLLKRGQAHIVLVGCNSSIKSVEEIKSLIKEWRLVGDSRYFKLVMDDTNQPLITKIEQHIYDTRIGYNTVIRFSDEWVYQQIQNAKYSERFFAPSKLTPCVRGSDVLLISPGPSLKKNIELAKTYRDRFIIFCPAQSYQALHKHKIQPDFVIAVDSQDYSQSINGWDPSLSQGLILAETCHENFFKTPNIPIYILRQKILPPIFFTVLQDDWRPREQCSVVTEAVSLICELGAKSLTLIGQDLSSSEGSYYHRKDEITSRTKSTSSDRSDIVVKGFYGEQVNTQADYFLYMRELELSASIYKDTAFYNCTEGGVYIDGFTHTSFADHIAANLQSSYPQRSVDAKHSPQLNSSAKTKVISEFEKKKLELQLIRKAATKLIKLTQKTKGVDARSLAPLDSEEQYLFSLIESNGWCKLLVAEASAKLNRSIKLVNTLDEYKSLSIHYYQLINRTSLDLIEKIEYTKKALQNEGL